MKRIFAHAGFSSALTLLWLNLLPLSAVPFAAAGMTVLFIVSLTRQKYRKAVAVPLCLGAAVFSCLLFISVQEILVQPLQLLDGRSFYATFYLTQFPQETEYGYMCEARCVSIIAKHVPQHFNVRLYAKTPFPAVPYQLMRAKCSFAQLGNTALTSGGAWSDLRFVSAQVKEVTVLPVTVHEPLYRLLCLRADIAQTMRDALGGDAGALSAAFMTGDKSLLSDTVYYQFLKAGSFHIVAISALHLSVIAGAAHIVLKRLPLPSAISDLFVLVLIFFYCALAGFPASACRAGWMMAMMLSSGFFDRRGDSLNSLGFAVFVMALNPFVVCDIGAVLSVLSALALTTVYPLFREKNQQFLKEIKRRDSKALRCVGTAVSYVVNSVSLSAILLLYTMPAMVVFFGYFSAMSLLSNLIVVPLGSLSTMLSPLIYAANKIHLLPLIWNTAGEMLNGLILKSVAFFSSFPFFTPAVPPYGSFVLAGGLVLISFCFLFQRRMLLRRAVAVSCVALTACLGVSGISSASMAQLYITRGGACVMSAGDAIAITGVTSFRDYQDVSAHLMTCVKPQTVLICEAETAQHYGDAWEHLTAGAVCVPAEDEYIQLNERLRMQYQKETFFAQMDGVTVSNCAENKADIMLGDKTVSDKNGVIYLQDGSVIYTIQRGQNITVRRHDIWQKSANRN